MRQFFRKLVKVLGYTAATIVILLAIAVGLFRLFLPRLPEYQDQIKIWASDAIGMEVEFSGMNARWALTGPQLDFYNTELIRTLDEGGRKSMIAAEVVSIGISLSRLALEGALVVDRLAITNTSIEIHQLDNGEWWIQGTALDELPITRPGGAQRLSDVEVVGEDIEIQFLQPGDQRPRLIDIPRAGVSVDENRVALDATLRLSEDLGREVQLSATRLLDVAEDARSWDVAIEADDILLAGWSRLQPAGKVQLVSGNGNLDLSLVWANGAVSNAIANADFSNVAFVDGQAFDLQGRFELDLSFDGWLVAAEELSIVAGDHEWPESSLRAEASVDADGEIAMLNLRASYLNLADSLLLMPVLNESRRAVLTRFSPSGEIRDLTATISDLGSDTPRFDISVHLADAGVAADGKWPGIRGFTGHIRANRSGGRVEIRSSDMVLDLPQIMEGPVDIQSAAGTLLWRSSNNETIVLSDSIRIISPAIEINSNVRLTIGGEGGAPDIDLASSFRVADISAARSYLPSKIMPPTLFNWFQRSLVSGSLENGSLTLSGPLDKFPFDNDEGRFRIDTTARNTTLKYHPEWPAAEQADIDIILDKTRLYSVRNRTTNAGNIAVNTRVDIPELRNPVLEIEGLITGTLETLRQFALQSPLDRITAGNLERLTVSGDAAFNLDLRVPLKDPQNTTVIGLLRSSNGTLAVEGLKPPVTDLIGEITFTRDSIIADYMGGRFLGEEVDLAVGPGEDPRFFAVVTATGSTTATALVEELGLPFAGLISGATDYTAHVLFPSGGADERPPLTVRFESDLVGLAVDVPDPLQKPAADAWFTSGDIRFLPDGQGIETSGFLGEDVAWRLAFNATENGLDFERGLLTIGGGEAEPPDTRGLHIRGTTEIVRLDEWLDLSTSDESQTGAADRIRSIDLTVENLFAVGQHLQGHRVRLDRSALDWLVQVDGEHVIGSIFVPYEFGSERAMVIEMERMHLPGDEVTPPSESTLDPRTLPPITLTAADFALGERYFGAVDLNLLRTPEGLEIETLTTRDSSFEVVANGRWVADENEELGSRTYLTATLNSTGVAQTMARLDFAQGISGDSMGIVMDLSWSGGPRASFFDVLDGEVRVRMEQGQLEEVEPGAGRMLGLVSFVALPRRLSLDFRDVFSKGFGYDTIAGSFSITDGYATTCDLSLEGPAANIGIVGGTNLATSEYEQGAVISASVGNALPIVGAVVGGPPGAAAMLIFSQIFKEPLQEVGQVFYGISGPWEDPAIEPVDSDDFVRYGELAGCLPEE